LPGEGELTLVQYPWRASWQWLSKLKMHIPWTHMLLPGIYLGDIGTHVRNKTHAIWYVLKYYFNGIKLETA
jgi:hypothetical protein